MMAKYEGCTRSKMLSVTNKSYNSCIRINGLRILPPILNEEKRNRMKYYRQLAMKVEENIKNRTEKPILSDSTTDEYQSPTCINSSSSDSVYSSDDELTFRSQIFPQSSRSDVLKMLTDSPKAKKCSEAVLPKVPLQNSDTNKCLSPNTDLPRKINLLKNSSLSAPKPNLAVDTTEQKQIINNDVIILSATSDKPSDLCSPNEFLHQGAGDNNLNEYKNEQISPPGLIRSNSYILETPSPLLLALMKQNTEPESDNMIDRASDSGNKTRRSWDLENARQKWSSIEHDLNTIADKLTFGGFNSVPPSSASSPEKKMFDNKSEHNLHFPEKELEIPTLEMSRNPQKHCPRNVKALVTPVRARKLEKYASKTDVNHIKIPNEIILPKTPDILSSAKSEKQIHELMEQIHGEQSKQMSNLIARQKKEQENLIKMFAEQQTYLLSQLRSSNAQSGKEPERNERLANTEVDIKSSEKLLDECKRLLQEESDISVQTLYLTSPDDSLNDITLKSCSPSPKQTSSTCTKFTSSFSIDSFGTTPNSTSQSTNNFCQRQLFPSKQQIWAATKINAVARGFLIRRLIKTDKVQNLIKTIRDTLVCAMELHRDTVDNIQPADVELHRRLIQQVTAACYTFHDTFFTLSRSEQLAIIASDRGRQKEKLLRPASAKSNVSLTSTTQKFLERKLNRRSSDSASGNQSRCSSSRSCYSVGENRVRTKSLGLPDSVQSSRKTSPQNDVMCRAMSYGANKKPWR